jgi:hypothetical protein
MDENNSFLAYDLANIVDEEFILEFLEDKYNCRNVDVTVAEVQNQDEYIFNVTITIPKGA